jgi:molybdopterin synthase catalytic subunit
LLVAVSSEHRAEAFAAALRVVDRVKESVPVWKKEFTPDGAIWQEGRSARPAE